jgi:hypothetical protein
MFSIKSLLGDAVTRSKIGRQMHIANTLRHADTFLQMRTPTALHSCVRALSVSEGILLIGCLTPALKTHTSGLAEELLTYVKQQEPKTPALRVQVRFVARFEVPGAESV